MTTRKKNAIVLGISSGVGLVVAGVMYFTTSNPSWVTALTTVAGIAITYFGGSKFLTVDDISDDDTIDTE